MGGELSWGSGVAVYVGVGAHKFVVGNRKVHLLSYNKEMCIVAVLYLIYEICDIVSQFQHYHYETFCRVSTKCHKKRLLSV